MFKMEKKKDKKKRSVVLNDNIMIKILRYLDLKEKTRIGLTSKQFQSCFDYILSMKKRFILLTCRPMITIRGLNDIGQDLLVIRTRDMNIDPNNYHDMGLDMKQITKRYESLVKKLKNLKEIEFWFFESSEEFIEWLAKIFTSKELRIRVHKLNRAHEVCNVFQKHFGSRIIKWELEHSSFLKMNLGNFENVEAIIINGYGHDSLISIACRIAKSVVELQICSKIKVNAENMHWLRPMANFNNIRKLCIDMERCDGLKIIGKHFPSLTLLDVSLDSQPTIDSLKAVIGLPLKDLRLYFRQKTNLCFKTFSDSSIVMKSVHELVIGDDYVIHNIQYAIHCFPSLKILDLKDLKTRCKYDCQTKENNMLCFDCIYSQIKDFALIFQMKTSIDRMAIEFWSDIDYPKHFQLLMRALFEVFVDCEQTFHITLETRDKKTIINAIMDLILFSTRSSKKIIDYMIGSAVINDIYEYKNIFPDKLRISSFGCRKSITEIKSQLTIICFSGLPNGYSFDFIVKNMKKRIDISIEL